MASSVESMEVMSLVVGDESVIKQCVSIISKLAPYKSNRFLWLSSGRSVERTALLIVARVSCVHF